MNRHVLEGYFVQRVKNVLYYYYIINTIGHMSYQLEQEKMNKINDFDPSLCFDIKQYCNY